MTDVDVAIVGASVAGSSAATMLGRQGLRVALLEKSPDPQHYKRLCTHELIGSANAVLDRLGVSGELDRVAGPHESPHVWSRYGWIKPQPAPGDTLEHGRNVRREVLDPIVRAAAVATDGVELMLGSTVTDLLRDGAGRPSGVRFRAAGGERELTARVVVGADGRSSGIARLAGVRARIRQHARFGYAAYFENVTLTSGVASQMWLRDPMVSYAFPTDGGLTLLATMQMRTPELVAKFKGDLDGAFAEQFDGLADGPDLSAARRASKFIGALKVENKIRPASAPGVAFVGDAAQTSDYLWGTGCGFALRSSEWLADSIGPVLASVASNDDVDRALAAYRRTHRRQLAVHHLMTSDYSGGRGFSAPERILFDAATVDGPTARSIHDLATRSRTPQQVLSPAVMARAAVVKARKKLVAA